MGRLKDLIDQQHRLIRDRALDALPDIYAEGGVFAMPGAEVPARELPNLVRAHLAAMPDLANEVTGWIEGDDVIALEQTIIGTHTGPMFTLFGVLAPIGRRIRQHAVEIVRARGGRIERWTTYVDLLPMMLELGVVTPAALPAR